MANEQRQNIIEGLTQTFNYNPRTNYNRSLVVFDGGKFILNRQDKLEKREDWLLQGTGTFKGLEFIFNVKQENSEMNDAEYIKPLAKAAAESLWETVGPEELELYLGRQ